MHKMVSCVWLPWRLNSAVTVSEAPSSHSGSSPTYMAWL